MILDVKTGKVKKNEGLGVDFEIRKNQYLYDEFIVSAKKLDVTEKNRFVVNITEKRFWQSPILTQYYQWFDVTYSKTRKKALEVVKLYEQEPEVTFLSIDSNEKSVMRETSTYNFAFPFIGFCKGGYNLMLSNMHYGAAPIEFHLQLKEQFMCWIQTDQDQRFDTREMSDIEKIKLYKDLDQEKAKRIISLTKKTSCDFYFLTNDNSCFQINVIRLYPYVNANEAFVEHFKCNSTLKKNALILKEVIQVELVTLSSLREDIKKITSCLVIQNKNQILLKSLKFDFYLEVNLKISPIRMQKSNYNSEKSEWIFVTEDPEGYKVRLLSLTSSETDPISTLYSEKSNKILSLLKLDENKFVLVDDTFILKIFELERQNKVSTWKQLETLDCTMQTKEFLNNNKDSIFHQFHRGYMTESKVVHISDYYFQFFKEQEDLKLNAQDQQVFFERLYMNQSDQFVRGPFQLKGQNENLAYIYKKNSERFVSLRSTIDSRLSLLLTASPSFATFLETKTQGNERILVCVENEFFIFKPNGQIVQKVEFSEIKNQDKKEDFNFNVKEVSNNKQFYIFDDLNVVYQLVKTDKNDQYRFEPFVYFSLFPKNPSIEKKPAAKTSLAHILLNQGSSQSITTKIVPIDEQRTIQRLDNQQTNGHLEMIFEEQNQEIVEEKKLEEEAKKNEASVEMKEEQKYGTIKGALQLRDNGSVWNFYTEIESKRVKLLVDGQIYEDNIFPQQLCKEFIEANNQQISMALVNKYLVFALKSIEQSKFAIYFVEIDEFKNQIVNKFQRVNLKVTQEWSFQQIAKVNGTDRVQFIFLNNSSKTTILITWNLRKNIEDRAFEIKGTDLGIIQGINSTLNYINKEGVTYDLEFGFPLNFFASSLEPIQDRNGAYMSEGKDLLLGRFSSSLMISRTLTELDRRFLRKFDEIKSDSLTRLPFPLNKLNFRTMDGSNVFHFLVQDYKILTRFYNNLKKRLESLEEEEDIQKQLQIFLLILYPNNKEVSPFEIALSKNYQFVNLFLQMLTEAPSYVLSKFIFKDPHIFSQLLSMKLPSFAAFIDSCHFQPTSLGQVERYWQHGVDEFVVVETNSTLLTKSFLRQNIGRGDDDPEEEEFVKQLQENKDAVDPNQTSFKKMQNLECEFSHLRKLEDKIEEHFGGKKKRIEVSIVEFDWIFKGDEGHMFIEELVSDKDDQILKAFPIKACIKFLWGFYFWKIFFWAFLPYFAFFIIFFVYSTVIFDGHNKAFEVNYILGGLSLLYCVIIIWMEIKQMRKQKNSYFNSEALVWNIVDFASSFCVIIFTLADFADTASLKFQREIASVSMFLLWIKFFYFLRIFSPTSAFIRMITEIIKDMGVFSAIYLLAVFAFANAYFLLDGGVNEEILEKDRIAGGVWWETILYVYMTGLGEFGTDSYNDNQHYSALWIYFILCTILVQLIFLNMLIAIMADTFDRVQELGEEASMKEICRLIAENWYWLRQEVTFKDTKQIVVFKLEGEESALTSSWDGKLASLKNFFKSSLAQVEEALKSSKAQQKDENQALQKLMTEKIQFMMQKINENRIEQDRMNQLILDEVRAARN